MIDLILDVEQYDCPFVAATDDHEVTFSSSEWTFDPDAGAIDVRVMVDAADPGALTNGLGALRDHGNARECTLVSKEGTSAEVETSVAETAAMRTVREYNGHVTEPFYTEDGSELWHLGFDNGRIADDALAELERDNEFTVESRERVDDAMVGGVLRNADAAASMLDGCRSLTEVERETLRAAVEDGYFDTPREITLGELADRFDVSKPAASKNLRRGQRKLLERAMDAIGELDGFP